MATDPRTTSLEGRELLRRRRRLASRDVFRLPLEQAAWIDAVAERRFRDAHVRRHRCPRDSAIGGADIAVERRGRIRPGTATLSFSQERMWFMHALASESAAYNIPLALRLQGPLDVPRLAHGVAMRRRSKCSAQNDFPSASCWPDPPSSTAFTTPAARNPSGGFASERHARRPSSRARGVDRRAV